MRRRVLLLALSVSGVAWLGTAAVAQNRAGDIGAGPIEDTWTVTGSEREGTPWREISGDNPRPNTLTTSPGEGTTLIACGVSRGMYLTICSGTLQSPGTLDLDYDGAPMKRGCLALLATGALLCGGRAYAHHSFAATYVENQQASIEGEVVQFVYRNPHALLQVLAPDSNRQLQRWTVEWEGRGQLDHDGVTSMTLKAGDRVVVTGNPGRNASDHWLRAQRIVRPRDGWKWTVGAAMR